MANQSRLVILGGVGFQGSRAVRVAVNDGAFSEVVIADVLHEEAKKLAAELDSPKVKVSAKHVDASDYQSALESLKGADVAISFIGPFYQYGVSMARAAIESKVHFIDICDDYQVTDEVLQMNEAAQAAGITVITGLGASPGVTQLVAKVGADELDEVDKIELGFFGVPALPFGRAVIDHFLAIMEGEVPVWRDGRRTNIPGFSEKETIYAPYFSPHGIDMYICGHPEPVTLPKVIKGVKEVTIKGGYVTPYFMDSLKFASDSGLTTTEPIKVGDALVSPRDFIISFFASEVYGKVCAEKVKELGVKSDQVGLRTRVVISGKKDGKGIKHTYDTWTKERETVHMTPVIAAEMIARGEIKTKGALPPEGIENPKRILDELARRGFPVLYELIEQTLL